MTDTTTLETKAVEILDKVTIALADAAKPAAEAVLMAVYFDGVAKLIAGCVGVAAFAASLVAIKRMVPWRCNKGDDFMQTPVPLVPMMVVGFLGLVLLFTAGANLLSAYTWAALFNPPAALALKILNGL